MIFKGKKGRYHFYTSQTDEMIPYLCLLVVSFYQSVWGVEHYLPFLPLRHFPIAFLLLISVGFIVFRRYILCDLNSFQFVEICFLTQEGIYFSKCPVCTEKECVICSFWVKCSKMSIRFCWLMMFLNSSISCWFCVHFYQLLKEGYGNIHYIFGLMYFFFQFYQFLFFTFCIFFV